MKKNLLLLTLLVSSVSFALAQETCTYPATTTASVRFRKILHPFTVGVNGSDTVKVLFAPGNLQYQASTGTWRFAAHQYDYIGNAPGNSVTDAAVRKKQSEWIDLFVYGMTGYDETDPTYRSSSPTSKHPKGWGANSHHMEGTNYDWGVYCKIQCGEETYPAGTYRTLTDEEWKYLKNYSKHIENGYIYLDDNLENEAISNKIRGRLLYPDDYDKEPLVNNTKITLTEWNALEKEGVVFLPQCGYYGSGHTYVTDYIDNKGVYKFAYYAYISTMLQNFWYDETTFGGSSSISVYGAVPVRLVKNY